MVLIDVAVYMIIYVLWSKKFCEGEVEPNRGFEKIIIIIKKLFLIIYKS